MTRLVSAELLKLRTTRGTWLLLLAALAVSALGVVVALTSPPEAFDLSAAERLRPVVEGASVGGLLAAVLGAFIVAAEYRHGTITATFLATPVRGRVVAAKLIAGVLSGLAVAVLCLLLTLALGLPWLAAKGVDGTLGALADGELLRTMLDSTAWTVVLASYGVGAGALVRSQSGAVVGLVLWLFVVEGLVAGFLEDVGRYLPLAALDALLPLEGDAPDLLPVWAGALLVACYAAGLPLLAARTTIRRDVG
jgi:ABC-2 type transport system permease protein